MTRRINWTLRGTVAALVISLGAGASANEQEQQKQQGMQDQSARTQAAQGQQRQTAQTQQEQAPTLVIGKVAEIRNVNLQSDNNRSSSTHRLVKVQRQDGQNVVVDAGVVSDSAMQDITAGDRIIAVGRAGRINDKPVIFARTLGELYTTGAVGSGSENSKTGAAAAKSSAGSSASASSAQSDLQGQANTGMKQKPDSPHGEIAAKAGQPTNVLAVGNITAARDVSLASTAGDRHRLLQMETKQGQTVVVDLGVPQGELKQANLSKGDRIVALGKPARINGRPVLFAANVAELQSVGKTEGRSTALGSENRSAQSSAKQSGVRDRSADHATVVYLFETDNLLEDDYGAYDEDFVWMTEDPVYGQWTAADRDSLAWESEPAHYDMFGYDDAGEEGLWDW